MLGLGDRSFPVTIMIEIFTCMITDQSWSLEHPSKVFQVENWKRDLKVTKRPCPEDLVKASEHDKEAERQRSVGWNIGAE